MPGYPDWQRYPSRTGMNLLPSYQPTLTPGTTVWGPFAVAQWSALSVVIVPSAGYGTVTVEWWSDEAQDYSVRSDHWDVNEFAGLNVIVPCFSAWVTVTADVTSTADFKAYTVLSGQAAGMSDFTYPVTGNAIEIANDQVSAAATATTYCPYVRKGLAYVQCIPNSSPSELSFQLSAMKADGTTDYTYWYHYQPAAAVDALIVVPDRMTALQVINGSSTTAYYYHASVVFT